MINEVTFSTNISLHQQQNSENKTPNITEDKVKEASSLAFDICSESIPLKVKNTFTNLKNIITRAPWSHAYKVNRLVSAFAEADNEPSILTYFITTMVVEDPDTRDFFKSMISDSQIDKCRLLTIFLRLVFGKFDESLKDFFPDLVGEKVKILEEHRLEVLAFLCVHEIESLKNHEIESLKNHEIENLKNDDQGILEQRTGCLLSIFDMLDRTVHPNLKRRLAHHFSTRYQDRIIQAFKVNQLDAKVENIFLTEALSSLVNVLSVDEATSKVLHAAIETHVHDTDSIRFISKLLMGEDKCSVHSMKESTKNIFTEKFCSTALFKKYTLQTEHCLIPQIARLNIQPPEVTLSGWKIQLKNFLEKNGCQHLLQKFEVLFKWSFYIADSPNLFGSIIAHKIRLNFILEKFLDSKCCDDFYLAKTVYLMLYAKPALRSKLLIHAPYLIKKLLRDSLQILLTPIPKNVSFNLKFLDLDVEALHDYETSTAKLIFATFVIKDMEVDGLEEAFCDILKKEYSSIEEQRELVSIMNNLAHKNMNSVSYELLLKLQQIFMPNLFTDPI